MRHASSLLPKMQPRFDGYDKDKIWGIVVMALASVGFCLGSITLLIGGAIGLFGSAAVASSGGSDARGAALATGGIGGLVAFVGVLIALSAILQIVGGFGILRSRRWAFVLTGALAILSFALGLASLPHGIVHIAINGVIGWYCWARLSGREGPAPV